jgi:DNA-binding NarL/FixJ family response regulator
MPLSILLIEPDPVSRRALRRSLATDPEIIVQGVLPALTPEPTAGYDLPVDVLLVESEMPDLYRPDALSRLRNRFPDADPILIGPEPDPERLFEALRAGASGYLPRTISTDALVKALRGLAEGEAPLSRIYTRMLVKALQGSGPSGEQPNLFEIGDRTASSTSLSPRESEVLVFVRRGYSNQDIARELVVEVSTVKTHVSSILRKTGARSRFALQTAGRLKPVCA